MNQLQKVPLFLMQYPSFVSRTPEAKVHRDHLKRISIIPERYRLHSFFFFLSGGVRTALDSAVMGTIHQRPLGLCLGENVTLVVCVSLRTEQSLSSRALVMVTFLS